MSKTKELPEHEQAAIYLQAILDGLKIGVVPEAKEKAITREQWLALVGQRVKSEDSRGLRPRFKFKVFKGCVPVEHQEGKTQDYKNRVELFPAVTGGKLVFESEFTPSFVVVNKHSTMDWRRPVVVETTAWGIKEKNTLLSNDTLRAVDAGYYVVKAPNTLAVMGSLLSDANCVRLGQSFEDFCGDLGYDTDSRKAEQTYKALLETNQAMLRMGMPVEAFELASQL